MSHFIYSRFGVETRAMIRLAVPLALAQLAQIAMGATDTVLLGSLGRDGLAAGGLGANLFFTLSIIMTGGMIPVSIVVSNARGAGEPERIGLALRSGLVLALLASIPPMLLLWNIEPILLLIGQAPDLAHAIARYDRVLLFAAPAILILSVQRSFLAAMGRPRLVMAVALGAVVINGLSNYGLIHGAWGLPKLGYIGSCTATLVTLWGMIAAIGLEMRRTKALKSFRLRGRIDPRMLRELAALGWPIALLIAIEIMLFSVAGLIIGRFGPTPLAAHQISMSVASVTFMVPLAISQAVNVRVGYHSGGRAPQAARLSGLVGLALGVLFMSLAGLTMVSIPRTIAGFYIHQGQSGGVEVVDLAARLLTIGAFFQVFDGAQTIAAGALRGLRDTRIPVFIAFFGYWAIGFAIAWMLGVRGGLGAVGIWWGFAAGLASVAILLSVRFWQLSSQKIAAIETPGAAALAPG
jgi:MATE family multidrug resistance protein